MKMMRIFKEKKAQRISFYSKIVTEIFINICNGWKINNPEQWEKLWNEKVKIFRVYGPSRDPKF